MDERLKKWSKKLSWLLRHGATQSGLTMDEAGWSSCEDVLGLTGLDQDGLLEVVQLNDKQRLQIEGSRVRATQGHSLAGTPVTLKGLEASWSEWTLDEPIWHGTRGDVLASIAEEGLVSQGRSHVHLAESPDSQVSKRASVDVLLMVDPIRLRADELHIYRSPNGVILVRHVPPTCIVDLRPLTRRSRKNEVMLRETLGLEPS